jgi:hypothetical protein
MSEFLRTGLIRPTVWLGISGLLLWCAALIWSGTTLLDHAYRPATIPADMRSLVIQSPDVDASRIQLLLFAHPFCPCTRATLSELEESLARLPADVSVRVVFVTCGFEAAEVEASSIVNQARSLSRGIVQFDTTGREARRFGATTSGEVFAVNAEGQVLFHGGLTPARGHQGDAAGQTSLELLAQGIPSAISTAPVFGCRLPGGERQESPPQ